MKPLKKTGILFSLLVLFISFPACSPSGDNAQTSVSSYPRMVERAKKRNHSMLMHSGIDTFLISSVVVEKNRQDFTVHLNRLDSAHRVMLNPAANVRGKQLHIYMRDSTLYTLDEPHTIPFAKVSRIESVN
jgi:hypothetical protein